MNGGKDRSPSSWGPRSIVIVLAVIDFLVAGYLAMYQWRIIDTVWDPVLGAGSMAVLDSDVSEAFHRTFGFPDAAVGALAYLAEVILGIVGSTDRWRHHPWLVLLFGADALAVTVAGVVLVFLQATVVHAWCLLCLVTAILSLAMLIVAFPEVNASIGLLARRSQSPHEEPPSE